MKYIVNCHMENSMDYEVNEFNTLQEAINFANDDFNYLNESDIKKLESYYILESVNPDEEAENHFDGDIIYDYLELYKDGKNTRI